MTLKNKKYWAKEMAIRMLDLVNKPLYLVELTVTRVFKKTEDVVEIEK